MNTAKKAVPPMNPSAPAPKLELGIKSDPIEYRYSFHWLFRLMRELGVRSLQLGSFFEMYALPDDWFLRLRDTAAAFDVSITSVFTAHRELGGLFQTDPAWHEVARKNLRRLVEIAALLGAECAGHNAGAVLRDRMHTKFEGLRRHLDFMKELLLFAGKRGVPCLTLEPMSCLAEPPTLPEEIRFSAAELTAWCGDHPEAAAFGYCVDISHGYADSTGRVLHAPVEMLETALPWLRELHLKNTDARFESTFGFAPPELERGVVDVAAIRRFLRKHADALPVPRLTAYLEIGGPKLGRDYSDRLLEEELRQSLAHLRDTWVEQKESSREHNPRTAIGSAAAAGPGSADSARHPRLPESGSVWAAPSVMCADLRRLEKSIRRIEALGAELLHFDIMDGHFTPNMPLGFELMKQARDLTALPFDVHLMTDRPEFFVEKSIESGADLISVHAESAVHLDRILARITESGAAAGVALNPATPPDVLEYVLDRIRFVLIMTVNPGFAGQKLVPGGLRKIANCRRFLDRRDAGHVSIQVDGNVSFENIPGMVRAGADILVLGTSSLFHRCASTEENWLRIRSAIAGARA